MNHDGLERILKREFGCWRRDPRALGLDWTHYDPECPPLLVIGGRTIEASASPLVIVSIEPLKATHFSHQVAFVGVDFAHYVRWNLDYFEMDVFPAIAGASAQPYWRSIADFVAGWASVTVDRTVPWPLLSGHLIELPYIPVHAKSHLPRASAGADDVLCKLLVERVEAVTAAWQKATFVVLSAAIGDRLQRAGLLCSLEPVPLQQSKRSSDKWGKRFDVPISRGRIAVLGEPLVFVRRGPFANWTNPKLEGRAELGSRLRAIVDQLSGAGS